ncbi:MAG: Ig-like domain-containing protein, partial [Candidatus Uhrbacteria bacterium]
MAQIFRKGLFRVLPGSVAVLMILTLAITFWQSMPVKYAAAVAGDGATSSIQLLDTVVVNGKIDRITFSIANPNGETWALQKALPYGLSVTYGGGDVTISSVTITSLATANPVTIQVDLDESDPQLLQNTAATAVELIYTQTSTWAACNTAAENGICDGTDEQMNAIATGDTGATDTEADGAAPFLVSGTYSDSSSNGTVDRVVFLFSEATTWTTITPGDWAFSVPGDINLAGDFIAIDCDGNGTATHTCTNTANDHITADPNETGKQTVGGTEPSFTYTKSGANDINDGINNTATFTKAMADGAQPIVAITDDQAGTANDADMTVLYTFEFTEAVQNFTTDDVTLNAGGTKGAFTAVDDDTYTLLITATDDSVTNISLTVVKDAFTDTNSIAMAANSTDATQVVDTRNPTVVISDDQAGVATDADATVLYTFEFSEDVTGFTTDDVTINAGGAKGAFTATDGNTYTVLVTATDDSVTNIDITAGNTGVIDANSNVLVASSNDATQVVDTRNPTVVISDDQAGTVNDADMDLTYTFEFSEDVMNFATADVTV